MKILAFFSCALGIFAVLVSAQTFHGKQYESQTSSTKSQQLTKAILSDKAPGTYYPSAEVIAELLVEDMNTSFDTVADDMPTQFGGLAYRKKLIHTVAVHGNAKWTPVSNSLQYTGIFASGCDNVVVRLSSAFEPTVDNLTDTPHIAPGAALKFLVDGKGALNSFFMYQLVGQSSWNFFAHDGTNHVPELGTNAPYALKLIRDKFSSASHWPTFVGLSEIAQVDQKGQPIAKPNFPFRIILHPSTQLHNAFPDTYPGVPFYQQLQSSVQPGLLYEVYAVTDPALDANVTKAVHIADLTLTTTLTSSQFGDRHLFLQHHRFENDLKIKPAWTKTAQAIVDAQRALSGQFIFPDLPWN